MAAACLMLLMAVFGTAWCGQPNPPQAVQRLQYLGKSLQDAGVTIHLTYTGEAKYGFGLIPDHSAEYRGLVNLSLHLDTGRLGLWPDGRIFVVAQNGHGNQVQISPGGNLLPISDIDARSYTQISQYGLNQGLLGGKLNLLAGKQDANTYFCVNDYGSQFLFPAYTLIPTVPLPTFPAPALGLTVLARPAARIHLKAGGYDGAPVIGGFGWNAALDGQGGYFLVFEPGIKPAFGGDAYGGHYRIGVWYHTGSAADIRKPESHSGNYGVYVMVNQLVYKEHEGGDQGLGLMLQLGWAPEDRNAVNRYVGAGFSYTGLLPGRDGDTLGFCASYSHLTGQSAAPANIDLFNAELYYSLQVDAFLNLQPDLQYFSHPGPDRENGWAADLRWVVSF